MFCLRWKCLTFLWGERVYCLPSCDVFSKYSISVMVQSYSSCIRRCGSAYKESYLASIWAVEPVQPLFWTGPWWHRQRYACTTAQNPLRPQLMINYESFLKVCAHSWDLLGWMVINTDLQLFLRSVSLCQPRWFTLKIKCSCTTCSMTCGACCHILM